MLALRSWASCFLVLSLSACFSKRAIIQVCKLLQEIRGIWKVWGLAPSSWYEPVLFPINFLLPEGTWLQLCFPVSSYCQWALPQLLCAFTLLGPSHVFSLHILKGWTRGWVALIPPEPSDAGLPSRAQHSCLSAHCIPDTNPTQAVIPAVLPTTLWGMCHSHSILQMGKLKLRDGVALGC